MLHEYDSIIREQTHRGIVEVVKDTSDDIRGRVHYLPHHAVIRYDKDTSKVRIVYDASARSSEGPSLNDCLETRPKFDQNILLRFCLHRVAVTADVEKAFLMVSVAKGDRDVLRFLWVDDVLSDQPNLIQLRFTRVVFGVRSSPFLLNATIRHHLEQYRDVQPALVSKLSKAAYVDDIITGANDAHWLFEEAKRMLAEGGFNLRKFCSISALLQLKVDNYDESHSLNSLVDSETYTSHTLGSKQPVSAGEKNALGI